MAVTVTNSTIFRVRPSGSSSCSGGFDPGVTFGITDLTATAANTASPVVTSATYTFQAGDVNAYLFLPGGSGYYGMWVQIVSVTGGAATLNASTGACLLYPILPSAAHPTGAINGDANSAVTVAGISASSTASGGTCGVDYSQQNSALVTF